MSRPPLRRSRRVPPHVSLLLAPVALTAIHTGSAAGGQYGVLDGSDITTDGTRLFWADEVGGGIWRVDLAANAVPAPASVVLGGIGAVCLAACRRRLRVPTADQLPP